MRTFSLFLLLAFSGSVLAQSALVSSEEVRWSLVNGNHGYSLQASGDLRSSEGATLKVESNRDMTGAYGGAIGTIDAVPLRGKVIRLSGLLGAGSGTQGAAIWMRVDGPRDKLKFATSASTPVTPALPAQRRSISLAVPPNASAIVLGVVMTGNGSVSASQLRASIDESGASSDHVNAKSVLDAALGYVRTRSMHKNVIDWDAVAKNLHSMVNDSEDAEAAYPAIRSMLRTLNDGHSGFLTSDQARDQRSGGAPSVAPSVRLLAGGVGYILVPGYTGQDESLGEEFSERISAQIEHLADDVTSGWIVDLRENTGGNMWPMLCALKPLLGSDSIGSFRAPDEPTIEWHAGDNANECHADAALESAWVAVLYGPRTNSSGEAVAVAFKGRQKTKSFGESTAGRSNANSSFELPDSSMLFLTTAVDVDRNGNAFGGKLIPDQMVNVGKDRVDDIVLGEASSWLLASKNTALTK